MTTIEFDKKLKCGNDFVAIEVLNVQNDMKVGNVYLPASYGNNQRLAHCKVTDVGKKAEEILGIKAGDYIMIDRLATFAWTAPSAVLKYDSVICKTNEDSSVFYPLKDTLFVQPEKNDDMTNVNGVMVVNYEKRLNLGKILQLGFETCDEYPFKVGDNVMLCKGGDMINFGNNKIFIYKKDMIICTVENK